MRTSTIVELMPKSPFNLALNQLKRMQIASKGFPWLLAMSLYSVSWGWSLLRPNTLYWDDWAFIYGQPKNYLNEIFVDTGLPPWRAIIDQELIAIGYWTIPVLTFIMFFATGIFLYQILCSVKKITDSQRKIILLAFLLVPINNSRIALVLFGYSTSYFLFFLSWYLLIIGKKNVTFIMSVILFFWSFMTHSFVFFYVLPVGHFFLEQVIQKRKIFATRVLILLSLPFIYFFLRSQFWAPTPEWVGYHRFIPVGAFRCVVLTVIGLIIIFSTFKITKKYQSNKQATVLTLSGWLIFCLGLFPYFANGRIPDYLTIIAFRSDWGGRHLMLTPLGISLMIGGVAEFFNNRIKAFFIASTLSICVIVNLFFSSQFFLDSLKKDELTNLFEAAKSSSELNEKSLIVFVDETKIFNGRFSTYRDPELRAKLEIADLKVASITGKVVCDEVPGGVEMRIKTKKNYVSALISRDLELYFEITKC